MGRALGEPTLDMVALEPEAQREQVLGGLQEGHAERADSGERKNDDENPVSEELKALRDGLSRRHEVLLDGGFGSQVQGIYHKISG